MHIPGVADAPERVPRVKRLETGRVEDDIVHAHGPNGQEVEQHERAEYATEFGRPEPVARRFADVSPARGKHKASPGHDMLVDKHMRAYFPGGFNVESIERGTR